MRKTVMILAGALMTAAIAGCGTAPANSASPPASSSSYGSTNYGSTATSSTPASSTTSTASVIQTGSAKVSGKNATVLQNGQGYTLYYFTKDTPTHSACDASAACSKIWLAVKASSVPHVSGASGAFSLVKGQVEYQGHLLYTYTGDKSPGQANGEGFLKEWWVATPSLKAAAAGGSSSSSGSGW